MNNFSIVIVAKNAEDKISRLLDSVQGLTDDVIVCDTGSEDLTINIAKQKGARVYSIPWKGYGLSKNDAIGFAKYEWILSLDSDEKVDPVLYEELKNWKPSGEKIVHQLLWKNFFADQWIRHSGWDKNWKNRLFNKKIVSWDDAIAHEDVTSSQPLEFEKMNGYLEHYSFSDTKEYASKMIHSAMITAQKYNTQGKKVSIARIIVAPLFSFLKSYIIKLGFLDGYKGWLIAVTTAYYTFIKYSRLYELNNKV